MKVTQRLIARHALTNTVFDRLLNAKVTRRDEAQAVPASLRDLRLTWRRNTQLQMIWLWKWLESQSNCIFSRWKDKCLFNLLCWSLIFFKHFKIMVGEALPPLTARHWPLHTYPSSLQCDFCITWSFGDCCLVTFYVMQLSSVFQSIFQVEHQILMDEINVKSLILSVLLAWRHKNRFMINRK